MADYDWVCPCGARNQGFEGSRCHACMSSFRWQNQGLDREGLKALWDADEERAKAASPRFKECQEVIVVAADVVARVMAEGAKTHAVGEWKGQDDDDHLTHAETHLDRWFSNRRTVDIEHAIVRLLMIVAKAKEAGK